ncbi:MAG: phosphoribosylanthranilate isomerase [Chloroflexota bacterium]
MTTVMVCGARTEADVALLARCRVDAMGLIAEVWQDIACNLSRARARDLAKLAPPSLATVLVITEEDVAQVCRLADTVQPDVVQLHGFNAPADVAAICERVPAKVVKTLHLRGDTMAEGEDWRGIAMAYVEAGACAILVDSYAASKVGGTGERVGLTLAKQLRDALSPVPLVLAGGLSEGNVTAAVAAVTPYGVDVLSGVVSGGYLNEEKVRRFAATVRAGEEVILDGRT